MEATHTAGRGRGRWPGRAARALVAMVSGLAVCSVLAGAASAPGGTASAVRAAAFSRLFGVSCASASDCWAVGRHDDTSTRTFRLVEHWNGANWRIVSVPSPPGAIWSMLSGVSCPGLTDCWAVGGYSPHFNAVPAFAYAEHWNGKQWSVVTLPNPPGGVTSGSGLGRVSCLSAMSCWAVGAASDGPPGASALIEHWNGHAWSIVPGPKAGGLMGVSCITGNDCWAVGGSASGTLTQRWNGTAWSAVKTPTGGRSGDSLGDVSCSGGRCMAVTGGASADIFAQRWTGSTWVVTRVARTGGTPVFGGVSCPSRSRCWAAGWHPGSAAGGPFAERWNGTSWRSFTLPRPRDALFSKAFDVSCLTAGDCWAVGDQFKTSHADLALFEHWNGRKWSVVGG